MNKSLLAHLALFTANLIYGINYTVAKDVMPDYIQPVGFILLRVSGAVVLFHLVYALGPKEKIAKKDIPRLLFCALFGVAVNQLLFFKGLNLTTPINAAIIMTTNPILVLLIAALLIKEAINIRKIAGILLGLVGAILLITQNQEVTLGQSNTSLGNIFVFINAASYGVYLVIVKPLMNKYRAITIIKWIFFFGFFFVFPFGFPEVKTVGWQDIPPKIWGEIAFVVIGTTFFAYFLNIYALKQLPAVTVSFYIYLQPLLAALVALVVGSDKPGVLEIGSSLLIFVGVYLVSGPVKKGANLSGS